MIKQSLHPFFFFLEDANMDEYFYHIHEYSVEETIYVWNITQDLML